MKPGATVAAWLRPCGRGDPGGGMINVRHPRRFGLVGLALLFLTGVPRLAAPARADKLPDDPVEKFRLALLQYKSRLRGPAPKAGPPVREKDLTAAAAKVVTLSDLSRALLLVEWAQSLPTAMDADRFVVRIYLDLTKRFLAKAKRVLARGTATSQVAVARLVEEAIIAAGEVMDTRPTVGPPRAALNKAEQATLNAELTGAVKELVALAGRTKVDRVRVAIAGALGGFPRRATLSTPTLKGMLAPRYPLATRVAAARALARMVEIVSGTETIRGSEPGVTNRDTGRSRQSADLDEVLEITKEAVPAAAAGLADASPLVRRPCATALHTAAGALSSQIGVVYR